VLTPCCCIHAAGFLSQGLRYDCTMTVAFMLQAPSSFYWQQLSNQWQVPLCTLSMECLLLNTDRRSNAVSALLPSWYVCDGWSWCVGVSRWWMWSWGLGYPTSATCKPWPPPPPQSGLRPSLTWTSQVICSFIHSIHGKVLQLLWSPFGLFGSKQEPSPLYAWLVSLCMLRPHHAQVSISA